MPNADRSGARRRQWGAERSTAPLPILHARPAARRVSTTRIGVVIVVLSWAMYIITTVLRMLLEDDFTRLRVTLEAGVYLIIVTLLSFSALMYLVSRLGAQQRFRDHRRTPRAQLDAHFSHRYSRSITVLIPSYVEDVHVVSMTIWSAALQEFPDLRVALLIDDPPEPGDPERARELEATRRLCEDIVEELDAPHARVAAARTAALDRLRGRPFVGGIELARLGSEYRWASQWLKAKADAWEIRDHTDRFFVDHVLRDLAEDLLLTVTALEAATAARETLEVARVEELYNRLVWIFSVSAHSFERKTYASLSHEANKAANLNAYISLMGHRLKRVETPGGVLLTPVPEGEYADLLVPDSDYLLTLDADSMLLRDYCLRLVHRMETDGNERVAVIQTPYSSFRGAPTRMERIAAATTDIQHQLHQGLTAYDATFWVGANAIIRKRALDDIVQVTHEGSLDISTYIQDRTVIEDTESSIDLGAHDWHLVNYPERLSYSATPPDFGSLVIQRRRWANGGLLILPKFLRQRRARRRTLRPVPLSETLLRVNYMASIAWASLGLLLLLFYPFDSRLLSPWVVAAAAPYFLAMAQDLKDAGYKRTDVFRIYGFNLLLLPVNVAGTLKSIEQWLRNEKIPFARTPKVANRTASPWPYVLAPYLIIAASCLIFLLDYRSQNWGNAAFAAFNAAMCAWALVADIGIVESLQDLVIGLIGWFFVPERPSRTVDLGGPGSGAGAAAGTSDRAVAAAGAGAGGHPQSRADWQSMIYYGQVDPDAGPRSRTRPRSRLDG